MSQISDVNWLLGTVTQSSAALIAIVGGLLVSRYVALHAEQEGAGRRVEDLKRRREEALHRRSQDLDELKLYRVNEVLNSSGVYEEIVAKKFRATIPDVLVAAEIEEETLDIEKFKASLLQLNEELKVAHVTLNPLIPISEDQTDWNEFKRSIDIPLNNPSAWRWTYEEISVKHADEAARRAEAKRARSHYGGYMIPKIQIPNLYPYNPTADGINRLMNSQYDLAREETLQRQIEQSTAEVRATEQEQRLAEETLQATRQPAGFSLALQVLSVLAVLGIAVPVCIMSTGLLMIPFGSRLAVIALFFVGVSFLLRFLFVYASFLHEGGRKNLPRTVFGLLTRG